MSTVAQRLEAVGHTTEELEERAADIGMPSEEVLARWERLAALRAADPLAEANEALGLEGERRLTGFLEERGDARAYVFVGPDGSGRLTVRQLLEFRYAQPAIMEATGVLVADLRGTQWKRIVRSLMDARTVLDLGDEATPGGRGRAWLRS